jgi:hypothetical protein
MQEVVFSPFRAHLGADFPLSALAHFDPDKFLLRSKPAFPRLSCILERAQPLTLLQQYALLRARIAGCFVAQQHHVLS